MRETAFITRSLHQLKIVFRQQPLEILLLTVFSVPFLLLDYNGFLRQHFAYWLFYPIYFAVIYLLRPHRVLYWISPFLLGTMTFLLVVNFGDNLNVYSAKPEYWGMLLIALICLLSQGWQKTNKDYVSHVVNRGVNLFLLAPIPAYLCLAAFAITLTTTTYLFGLKIGFDYMWNKIFLFCTFGLVPLFFLLFEKQGSERDFNRFTEILINFILSPALIIYSVILYLYLAKIGISMELPKGNLSFIVLPYLAAGIALSALQTILTKPRWRWFYRLLPYIFLAPLVLLWIGIYERISTYGLTELRIYLLSIALTLTAFCVLSLWKKLLQYRYLAMIAIVAVFITTVVINPQQITFNSQNARFYKALDKAGMLDSEGKMKTDFDTVSAPTEKDLEQYRQLAHSARELLRVDERIYQQYGAGLEKLLEYGALKSERKRANNKVYSLSLVFDKAPRIWDITPYKRLIRFYQHIYAEDTQAGKHGDESQSYELVLDENLILAFEPNKMIHKIFRNNGVDPLVPHSERDLQRFSQQLLQMETEQGLLFFSRLDIRFQQGKGYIFDQGEVSLFLEK